MEAFWGAVVGGLISILTSYLVERGSLRRQKAERAAALEQLRLQLQWQDELSCVERQRQAARRLLPIATEIRAASLDWIGQMNLSKRTDIDQAAALAELKTIESTRIVPRCEELQRVCVECLVDTGPKLYGMSQRILEAMHAVGVWFHQDTAGWPAHAVQDHWERKSLAATELRDAINEFREAVGELARPVTLARADTESASLVRSPTGV